MATIPKPDDTHIRQDLADRLWLLMHKQGRVPPDIEVLEAWPADKLRRQIARLQRLGRPYYKLW